MQMDLSVFAILVIHLLFKMNYLLNKQGWWLADTKYEPYPLLLGERGTTYSPLIYQKHNIYLSFLQTCMEFFCQSIVAGIPLRGCVATGFAVMDSYKSIYLGNPLVEAARGEPAQDALGIAFGRSFNNYHPVYNDYFIPYLGHFKKIIVKRNFLVPCYLIGLDIGGNRQITDTILFPNI